MTEQRAAHPQETRAPTPKPARQHAPSPLPPLTGSWESPLVRSGQGLQACAATGSRLDGPRAHPCRQQPADPAGQRGDSPSELGLRRCPPCEFPTPQGPWPQGPHPQQGALVDPGRLRWGVCRPLSSPGTREGHSSPSRQVLAVVMGRQSVLFSQAQNGQLCPHFLEVPQAVAPGKPTPHPVLAWTRAWVPIIPLEADRGAEGGSWPGSITAGATPSPAGQGVRPLPALTQGLRSGLAPFPPELS